MHMHLWTCVRTGHAGICVSAETSRDRAHTNTQTRTSVLQQVAPSFLRRFTTPGQKPQGLHVLLGRRLGFFGVTKDVDRSFWSLDGHVCVCV